MNKNFDISDLDNLLLTMSAGLLPCQLDIDEVNLLKEVYGDNWFTELGYTDEKYERSKYDHTHINNNYYKE